MNQYVNIALRIKVKIGEEIDVNVWHQKYCYIAFILSIVYNINVILKLYVYRLGIISEVGQSMQKSKSIIPRRV